MAELDGRPAGWAAVGWKDGVWWLDDLWVLPPFMGRGVGAALFAQAASRGRELGARRMELESDPYATGFYERMGARHVRDSEPTVWSRELPIYALDLE